ncbi:hypothetical protein [Rhodococcus sp. B7740]|uniref:hypothetical protein n=1 Tax=Rhodococcus sp. B7740 TaxID=1564114 RepID=UPI0005EB05DD|nr:hypothetical protein [Rhodococcus sp. B7740]
MPPTPETEFVSQHPIYLYAALLLAVVVIMALVSEKVRQVFGPIGTWISTRKERATERKRKQLISKGRLDDERLATAEKRIEYLEKELADERAEKQHYSDQARSLSRQLAEMKIKLDELTVQVIALRRDLELNGRQTGGQ